jgi:DNA-binding response OmpR family regulator
MENKAEILLVEDDENFGEVLKSFLEMQGWSVNLCNDGDKGYAAFRTQEYDLCLLDVMMPNKDGFTLAAEIRKHNSFLPLVFITAKSQKHDVLQGFEIGADDYITKPFDSEILVQKIKALLRRTGNGKTITVADNENITIGKFQYDPTMRLLTCSDKVIQLSPREADLLKLFFANEAKLVERSKALLQLWGEDNYFTARSMDVYIARLRKYLKQDPTISIVNIQRKGYRLVVSH